MHIVCAWAFDIILTLAGIASIIFLLYFAIRGVLIKIGYADRVDGCLPIRYKEFRDFSFVSDKWESVSINDNGIYSRSDEAYSDPINTVRYNDDRNQYLFYFPNILDYMKYRRYLKIKKRLEHNEKERDREARDREKTLRFLKCIQNDIDKFRKDGVFN